MKKLTSESLLLVIGGAEAQQIGTETAEGGVAGVDEIAGIADEANGERNQLGSLFTVESKEEGPLGAQV